MTLVVAEVNTGTKGEPLADFDMEYSAGIKSGSCVQVRFTPSSAIDAVMFSTDVGTVVENAVPHFKME